MKHLTLTAGILCVLGAAALADVGKEELKKLAQAGLSEELILSYVRSKGSVARLSADDIVELKRSGLSDSLLEKLVAWPEPAIRGTEGPLAASSSNSTPSSTATARAKLLSDPSVIYDGRYYYPRSYFTSEYSAYCSPALGIGVTTTPVWVASNCNYSTWYAGRTYRAGYVSTRAGFGAWGSGGARACNR